MKDKIFQKRQATKFVFTAHSDIEEMLQPALENSANNGNVLRFNRNGGLSTSSLIINNILFEHKTIIGEYCPLLSELTWAVLLRALRKLQRCQSGEALPSGFGDQIRSKDDLFIPIRQELGLDDTVPYRSLANNLSGVIYKVACRELADLSSHWLTVRAAVYVVQMADFIITHAPERWKGESPYAVAARYYRGDKVPALVQ